MLAPLRFYKATNHIDQSRMTTEKKELSALPGHIAMLLASILWGGMSPFAKDIMLTGYVSPIAMSTIRIGGGALLFALAALLLPAKVTGNTSVRREDWVKIVTASLLMVAVNQAAYIIGVGYTTPIDASVMATLTPVITLILAAIFIHMPLSWLKVIGVMLGLGGALLLTYLGAQSNVTPGNNPILGNSLCLCSQFCAAIYYISFRKLISRYSAFTLMSRMFIISAIIYVPCTLPWLLEVQWSMIDSSTWLEVAYIILCPTFMSYMLMPVAQRRLKPTTVSMYSYVQPVTAAAIAAAMGIAAFGIDKGFATILIFAGVAMVARSRGPRTVSPD
jgi:drug/metabolite transporter (DMT)-like permease